MQYFSFEAKTHAVATAIPLFDFDSFFADGRAHFKSRLRGKA